MKILVTDGIAEEAVKYLEEQGHQVDLNEVDPAGLLDVIGDYEAVIVRSRTKMVREAIEKGEKLKVIGRAGIGTDNIDKECAKEKGIAVVNAPMGSTVSVAELAMGLMISVSRHIVVAARQRIQSTCGIPGSAILVGASHTHTGGPIGGIRQGQFDHASDFIRKLAYEEAPLEDPVYARIVTQVVSARRITVIPCAVGA